MNVGAGPETVKLTAVACAADVPVPVTVIVYVPVGVLEPTVAVIVEEPPAVTEAGLKLADAPAGRPLALRLTVCADPLVTAVEMVDVPLAPCAIVRLLGLAKIEKSGGGGAYVPRETSSRRK